MSRAPQGKDWMRGCAHLTSGRMQKQLVHAPSPPGASNLYWMRREPFGINSLHLPLQLARPLGSFCRVQTEVESCEHALRTTDCVRRDNGRHNYHTRSSPHLVAREDWDAGAHVTPGRHVDQAAASTRGAYPPTAVSVGTRRAALSESTAVEDLPAFRNPAAESLRIRR